MLNFIRAILEDESFSWRVLLAWLNISQLLGHPCRPRCDRRAVVLHEYSFLRYQVHLNRLMLVRWFHRRLRVDESRRAQEVLRQDSIRQAACKDEHAA